MSRYKVLQMPTEFSHIEEEFEWLGMNKEMERYNKVEPAFNRNGYYYDRETKLCWVETPHGCWEYDFDMFEYKLGLLNHKRMSQRERNAVQTLINLKVCPRELKEKLRWDNEVIQLHDVYWNAMSWKLKGN